MVLVICTISVSAGFSSPTSTWFLHAKSSIYYKICHAYYSRWVHWFIESSDLLLIYHWFRSSWSYECFYFFQNSWLLFVLASIFEDSSILFYYFFVAFFLFADPISTYFPNWIFQRFAFFCEPQFSSIMTFPVCLYLFDQSQFFSCIFYCFD